MNRVIKFRAWDNNRKEMLMDVQDGHDFGQWQPFSTFLAYDDHDDTFSFELMQFTGLKDKNGKEIYEGDIVRVIYEDDMIGPDSDYKDEVYFDEEDAGFMIRRPIGADAVASHEGKSIEIIGNIYENPDLLK